MDGLVGWTTLILLSMTSIGWTPPQPKIVYEFICDYCVEYNPPHWEADGFPPITMIDLGET